MEKDIKTVLVPPEHTIRETMEVIDKGSIGLALVVDEQRKVLGSVSDGDIRRAILRNVDLDTPIEQVMHREPICYPIGTPNPKLLKIMDEKVIRQIPLLDENDRVVDIALLSELTDEVVTPSAIVLAGGLGTRLRPLTEETPKPMLKVGNKPIIETIIDQLNGSGIQDVVITTGYKAEKIESHFSEEKYADVNVSCVRESKRLGTAGPVALAKNFVSEPVLVINGDILTQLSFRRMVEFHLDHKSVMTVGIKQYDYQLPYGVIQVEDDIITELVEKPTYQFFVNAGIYLMNFEAINKIPEDSYIDMTDVIEQLIEDGYKVCGFPICEYWLDIGKPEDFEQANRDIEEWEDR